MFDRKSSTEKSDPEHTAPESMASSEKPGRPTPHQPVPRTTATIGATVKIRGDVISDENLLIEGEVEGSITVDDHEVTVGESGRINADITAKAIRIDGHVQGDLTGTERLVISRTGNVRGNVISPRVILEDGGRVNGSIDMAPAAGQAGGFATKSRPAAKPHLQAASSQDKPEQVESPPASKQG